MGNIINMDNMDKGKDKCELLKAIRKHVAEKYGLEYTTTECTHRGDCPGTCPKCDAELANLQRQLEQKGITDITQDEKLSELVENYVNHTDSTRKSSVTHRMGEVSSFEDEDEEKEDSSESDGLIVLEGDPMPELAGCPAPGTWEGMLMPPEEPKLSFQRKVILECPVAGIGFHNINDIWDELYVGAKIALVRERNNKHDSNAVAVALADDYDGDPDNFDFEYILGYIPRKNNTAIAAMLDMGWQDQIEAEISELNDHAPYSDRLHITVYIRSKEPEKPKDDRLRIKTFEGEEEWKEFTDELWKRGTSHFRWGGFPPWELDLPEKGDKVVFIRKGEQQTELYLMMVIAMGDDCAPFVDDVEELHMIDDCCSYVLTVVKGPVMVECKELAFLNGQPSDRWQPDFKLEKDASDALLDIVQQKFNT